MWPDRVSNTGPLTLDSDALPSAPRGSATTLVHVISNIGSYCTVLGFSAVLAPPSAVILVYEELFYQYFKGKLRKSCYNT